jgi:transposase
MDLWSLDECHFQQHGSRCVMWVPPEDKDPVIQHAPTRKNVALFGAVNVLSGQFVYMLISKFDASTFRVFMGKLLRHRKRHRKMAVILDNARYHHAAILNPFLEFHKDHLSFEFLPPYSPELNPIERVWKLTRRLSTHNQYFPSLEGLISAVSSQLDLWNKPNDVLSKLCCIN